MTLINTDTTAKQTLASGDSLTVIAGINLDVDSDYAITTTFGNHQITIGGYVYGYRGAFQDTSTTGNNNIIVSKNGSMLSWDPVISSNGGYNHLINAGTIDGWEVAHFKGANNTINNSGIMQGQIYALNLEAGYNHIYNTGVIANDSDSWANVYINGSGNYLRNSGAISGGYAAVQINDTANEIVNDGSISGSIYGIELAGATGGSNVINTGTITGRNGIYSLEASTSISNSGTVTGTIAGISISGSNSTLINTGTISGTSYGVYLSGSDNTLINSGRISGTVRFGGGASVYDGALGSVAGSIQGGSGTSDFTGGVGAERFVINSGAAFTIDAGGGNDVVFTYGNMSSSQHIDGGAGTDVVQLAGDYSAGLAFNDTTMSNVEILQLGAGYNYNLTMNELTVAAGQRLTVNAAALASANALTLNASDETDGYYSVVGGAGADSFAFDPASFSRFDVIKGGDGTAIDTLRFATAGTISASALLNTSGIEKILLGNGANSLTLTDALVGSANGALLSVFGNAGSDAINAGVVGPTRHVQFYGAGGADTMTGGAGADYFIYSAAADSTGPAYDTIVNLNLSSDKLNLPGVNPITGIDAMVTTGALSTATFNTDLAAALSAGVLGAHHAMEFVASSGTLAGQTFLIADLNGTAGYQANADLVVRLAGATGTLTTTTFI